MKRSIRESLERGRRLGEKQSQKEMWSGKLQMTKGENLKALQKASGHIAASFVFLPLAERGNQISQGDCRKPTSPSSRFINLLRSSLPVEHRTREEAAPEEEFAGRRRESLPESFIFANRACRDPPCSLSSSSREIDSA
ncbi:hypothetical protein DM860_015937 [Cuscuta australis]|uniref:Uncharacterized protein n=1 Tax=Cuscuta australis TaxID=267555 RepID=A0A328E011_9ASTE|nr:hypothetical protein DM860_015937 [Cuscuta australis]